MRNYIWAANAAHFLVQFSDVKNFIIDVEQQCNPAAVNLSMFAFAWKPFMPI